MVECSYSDSWVFNYTRYLPVVLNGFLAFIIELLIKNTTYLYQLIKNILNTADNIQLFFYFVN